MVKIANVRLHLILPKQTEVGLNEVMIAIRFVKNHNNNGKLQLESDFINLSKFPESIHSQ